ncbi:MAG: molybdenum cofactor guanylyltransferase MobA [Pseudomonadota bacterium]
MTDVLGVVLAGGQSRRMNGPEKSLLKLGDKTLVEGISTRLRRQNPNVVINANEDPQRFAFLNLPVVADSIAGYAGPLAGVLAGMRWAQENSDATHIVTVAADTPFFPQTYVQAMIQNLNASNSKIALATSNGRRHPVFGLWSVDLSEDLQRFLVEEEGRKVMLFVERYSFCLVDFEGENPDPFFNVNTPQDMQNAERFAAESPPT